MRTNVIAPALACLLVGASWAAGQEPGWFPGTTVKLCQLTGDFDATRRLPTASGTGKRFGIVGTDLGSSFEHEGKLWFLFGDTNGRPGYRDVIGWTDATTPSDVKLDFHLADDGKFLPLTVRGIEHGAYEIPTCGISAGGRMVVLFTTDHRKAKTMGRSVLAASSDGGRTFEPLGELSRTHFINAAMARANRRDVPGLPADAGVLVFGSGDYRKSSPRLLFIEGDRFGDQSARSYWAGTGAGGPRWSREERDASALCDHPVVGEVSVAWIPQLSRWVMLYNSSEPRGIVMRTAALPWGPWSAPSVVFEPWRDGGYPQFMHVSWKHVRLDAFHDRGREDEWGGEYGPFLIPRFTTGDAGRCTLCFAMSTWNPYQVILARADVGRAGAEASRPANVLRTLPGSDGWTVTPGLFKPFERNGRRFVSTFADEGDKTTGFARYELLARRCGSVAFTIHGGHAEVVLVVAGSRAPEASSRAEEVYEQLKGGAFGAVVEAVAGADSNGVDVPVRWSVDRFAGQRLSLYVVDALTERWGFVSVSEIEITPAER